MSGNTPVANGSSVPRCPTRAGFTLALMRRTTSAEVIPLGLSMMMIPSMLVRGLAITVIVKVRRVGNSLGVVLNRHLAQALGVNPGAEIAITQTGGQLSMRK